MPQAALIFGLLLALCLVLFAVIAPILLRPTAEEVHLRRVVGRLENEADQADKTRGMRQGLLQLAARIRAQLGLSVNPIAQKRLEMAGYRGNAAVEVYFAASWLTPLMGLFAGSFVPVNNLFVALTGFVVGYLIPGLALASMVRRRQARIRRSLPDVIDYLVICMDAGLGLDQAMLRVGSELGVSHPELQQEITRLNFEQRAGKRRLEAWEDLIARVPLDELKMFGSMLLQAERFGTPLVKGMSRFAEDLRTRRRQHAEEAAAKTKVKIVFPLVFFIFPSLLIVLLAPALLSMFHELKGATQ